ncbi:tRNA glutamyl-Q(34) synthetase GluQRS [Luteimonas terricola]|uniref:Glutamyl-Q tRNA(Asp) synthetase n=1 Tax=Luteimonas terricola TaxID=645597 RepID=A0ABQ2E9Q5_9GAMM|nr:tRNA glutamyl-Q(34) synthetase GluQRS [Luteimonas terricola]GGK02520.1 glutamyl-Q tRNA(Asp) synthetase [Luteimonas terricola]
MTPTSTPPSAGPLPPPPPPRARRHGTVRGRFAPSPTGALHFGSLLAAFGSWLAARGAGGEWWIRIEDVDAAREVPGAAAMQLRTLAAFGLVHDGPVGYQSRRGHLYAAALARLLDAGLAFECHCSRSDVADAGGVHRSCRPGARRPDPAVRLRVTDGSRVAFDDAVHGRIAQDVDREVGDFVLRRADGWWAYQLAVVVDDADQGITDVVRGADLLDSTPRQLLLQHALGLPRPRYLHLPLVLDDDGHKLSKSSASLPVDAADPLPALRAAWHALGQDPHRLPASASLAATLAAAVRGFDAGRIPRGPLAATAVHNALAMRDA